MRFVTRFVRAAAAAALFLLAFSPVQAAENNPFENYKSPNGNTFVLTLFQNPRTLDIQKTNADYFIPLQIYSRLVEAEPDGKGGAVIVPGLAESWDISADGRTYTFHLRKGVTFHNGAEFRADDVLFTIDKMMNPEEKTLNTDTFEMIAGAKERLSGKAETVGGVRVIDDYTVEIVLETPYAPFLANLTDAPASIFNRKAVTEGGEKFGFDPHYTVGTGWMKFGGWKPDQEINLVRNDAYFGKRPSIDGVRYLINIDPTTERMMFENGELDVMTLGNAATYKYFTESEVWKPLTRSFERPGLVYMMFNCKTKPLDDVRVRKAIQRAVDRSALNTLFFNGTGVPMDGVIPPMIPGYTKDLPHIPFDPDEARALLKEAGFENGFDLLLIQNNSSKYTHPINEAVQAMLAPLGVRLTIKNLDMSAFWDTVMKGDDGFGIFIGPMTAGIPDADTFFFRFSALGSQAVGLNLADPELSARIYRAREMSDVDARIALNRELEKEIAFEKALYLPIVSGKGEWVLSPRLKNFHLSWQGWAAGATRDLELDPAYGK